MESESFARFIKDQFFYSTYVDGIRWKREQSRQADLASINEGSSVVYKQQLKHLENDRTPKAFLKDLSLNVSSPWAR